MRRTYENPFPDDLHAIRGPIPAPAATARGGRCSAKGLKCDVARLKRRIAAVMIAVLIGIAAPAAAVTNAPPPDENSAAAGSGGQWTFLPGGHPYPLYRANPLQPTMSIARAYFHDSDIPDTGDARYIIRLGGRAGFLRWQPDAASDGGFQLDVEAGFQGVFDNENSQDNIGWDGLYGVLLAWSNGRGFAAQTGIKHVSSHVGDEYAERTGRTRINYTRGEYVLGLSMTGFEHGRIYAEGGYAYDQRNEDLQEPWRLEAGLEYLDPHRFWGGRFGWYAAADFNWYEESDWSTDVTLQAGLLVAKENLFRTFRLAMEYRDGRSVLGEFFQSDESYVSLGVWVDF